MVSQIMSGCLNLHLFASRIRNVFPCRKLIFKEQEKSQSDFLMNRIINAAIDNKAQRPKQRIKFSCELA